MPRRITAFKAPDDTWRILHGVRLWGDLALIVMVKWRAFVAGIEWMPGAVAIFIGPFCLAVGRTTDN